MTDLSKSDQELLDRADLSDKQKRVIGEYWTSQEEKNTPWTVHVAIGGAAFSAVCLAIATVYHNFTFLITTFVVNFIILGLYVSVLAEALFSMRKERIHWLNTQRLKEECLSRGTFVLAYPDREFITYLGLFFSVLFICGLIVYARVGGTADGWEGIVIALASAVSVYATFALSRVYKALIPWVADKVIADQAGT